MNTNPAIHDISLNMSSLTLNVGKNSTLMLDIHKDSQTILSNLKYGIYSSKELNYQNDDGWTILHYLCRNAAKIPYSHDLIEFLLSHPDVDVNLTEKEREMTALMLATCYSNTDSNEKIVEMLLQHPNIDVNKYGKYGWFALLIAATNSNITSSEKTVEILLQHPNINVNLLDNHEGWSALMMACRHSNGFSSEKTVEILLNAKNINVNLQNKYGFTALMFACQHSNANSSEKTVEMLLQHPDIDVNLQKRGSLSALILSCRKINTTSTVKTIQMLLQHPNINVNLKNDKGYTTLMDCILNSDISHREILIKLLLQHNKIDINARQTDTGITALMLISLYNYLPSTNKNIIKILLKHKKININLLDNNNNSALHYACTFSPVHIIDILLREKYINIYYTNNIGLTALDLIIIRYLSFIYLLNNNNSFKNIPNDIITINNYTHLINKSLNFQLPIYHKILNILLQKYDKTTIYSTTTKILLQLLSINFKDKTKHLSKNPMIRYFLLDNNTDNECSICIEQINNDYIILPCKHQYHINCIQRWIFNDDFYVKYTTCPTCRVSILNNVEQCIPTLKQQFHLDDNINIIIKI